jgi:hypothetical protein
MLVMSVVEAEAKAPGKRSAPSNYSVFGGRLRVVTEKAGRVRVEVNGETTFRARSATVEMREVGGTELAFVDAVHDYRTPGGDYSDGASEELRRESRFDVGWVIRVYQNLDSGTVLLTKIPGSSGVVSDTNYWTDGLYVIEGRRATFYWWGSDVATGDGCNSPSSSNPLTFCAQTFLSRGGRRMLLESDATYRFKEWDPVTQNQRSSPKDATFYKYFDRFLDQLHLRGHSIFVEGEGRTACITKNLCNADEELMRYVRQYLKIGECPESR